jgi:phospholipid/cholesterol/gamma-HCH transport system ATP-binding protein
MSAADGVQPELSPGPEASEDRPLTGASPDEQPRVQTDSDRELELVVDRLSRAVQSDPDLAGRLALAGTSVELGSRDSTEFAMSAWLTPERVEFGFGPRTGAEVDLSLGPADLSRFCLGQLSLPVAILAGQVEFRGPVRKFLRVAPIVSDLLAGGSGSPPTAGPEESPPIPASSDERRSILEQAAGYAQRRPEPPAVAEVTAGDFWAIECRDLRKRFDSHVVLDGVDLGIPEGAISVILGPSGTGKSVLLKHMIGLVFPDTGEVLVHGRSLSRLRLSELLRLRRRFGILFQDGALFSSMSVYDNVAFPLRQHTDLSEGEISAIVQRRLNDVGLAESASLMPNELSGGMRKRAGLARAIVFEPEVVLFDEPDSGLDPVRTALLCELIRRLHAEYGGTYIVITHDIATARRIGEYIVVLWNGGIVQAGSADAMFNSSNPFVRQFLTASVEGPLGMD